MTVALKFAKDARGYNTFAATPADVIYNATLAAGVATSVSVPSSSDYYTVAFNYEPGSTFWVDATGTDAASPSDTSFTMATSVLNPSTYLLEAGATISVLSDEDNSSLSISMWQGGNL